MCAVTGYRYCTENAISVTIDFYLHKGFQYIWYVPFQQLRRDMVNVLPDKRSRN